MGAFYRTCRERRRPVDFVVEAHEGRHEVAEHLLCVYVCVCMWTIESAGTDPSSARAHAPPTHPRQGTTDT